MTDHSINSVAVIIVNYKTPDLAILAADSILERDHGGREVSVHLVDNASGVQDVAHLQQEETRWQGRVTLHLEDENHGFGRGNNVVLHKLMEAETPPDAVFLLNPDARLENEAIDLLAKTMELEPQMGFAGAAIENPGQGLATAAFRFPSLASEFSSALSFGPIARLLAHRQVPLPAEAPKGEVDWVAGAAVLIRMQCLREIGFFDPAFFLYYEEVDLMRRAKTAGWQVWYVPEARVIHEEGAATQVKSGEETRRRRPTYLYHSWQHYFRTHHGRAGAVAAGVIWALGATGNHVLSALRGKTPAAPLHLYGDLWRFGLRPLLGLRSKDS